MGDRDPRERARRHLKKLMTGAVATGAALNITACPIVCDPLPAPPECTEGMDADYLSEWLYIDAVWRIDGDTATVLVTLEFSHDDGQLSFTGDPAVTNGTLVESAVETQLVSCEIAPDDGATEVDLSIATDCEGIGTPVLIRFDVSGTAQGGENVPSSLVD